MKYKIFLTTRFKKDAKKLSEQDRQATIEIIDRLAAGKTLEPKYKDHPLTGKLKGYRDCHVKPDLVLIYKIEDDILLLSAYQISSHSNLF